MQFWLRAKQDLIEAAQNGSLTEAAQSGSLTEAAQSGSLIEAAQRGNLIVARRLLDAGHRVDERDVCLPPSLL
jgi:hypothetical protein